jgi:hypothetical protein
MLPATLTQNVGRNILKLKKQSPHIFFAAGVIGSIASTVMACRATLKLSDTLDDIQVDLASIKSVKPEIAHEMTGTLEYTDTHYKRDLVYVYAKSGLKIGKLYAPAALVGTASIMALTGSHVQLTRRNASLMAAYAAIQKAYDEYRERVREQLGDERELDIYHSAKTNVVDVDGKKEEVKTVDPNTWSPYAVIFDEACREWTKDPEMNRLFVQSQQNYMNHILRARGHLFLNEVYDALGFERTKAGAVVGWVIGKDGDNYVDFGMFDAFSTRFVNGSERSIVLDFNVDGVIYDKI